MVHRVQVTSDGGTESYPLTPMQQGMLYHALQGGRGVDVQQVIGELDEEVDPARFEQAWRDLMARHPVLRTSFEWPAGAEPRQIVRPISELRLTFRYEEFGCAEEAQRGLEEYLRADRQQGFPLLEAPLLRVALLRGEAGRCCFVATYHHLILDARSMTVLFREVLERHDALLAGESARLSPGRPFREALEWLRLRDAAGAEAFWREYLAGIDAPTPAPAAASAAEERDEGNAAAELMLRLPPTTMLGLKQTAQRHGVTVNTLVQAAWALVLARYSGESDVVFGAVRAGRHLPIEGVEEMLGLFINTVPVRTRVASERRIQDWLGELRCGWVAMRPFEQTPLYQVQAWSGVAAGRPLFETLLNYQEPAWHDALQSLGGRWAGRRFDLRSRPNYPLAIDVYGGSALTVRAFYEAARCDAAMVAQILGHFRTALEALAEGRAERIGEIPWLSASERRQVLHAWNETSVEYPDALCVHHAFEVQAAAHPARLAAADASVTLTYAELNARANRLARALLAAGVRRGSVVAVCVPRSPAMLVGWLGALKAGAAFVPLDPSYPRERLAFQVQDCGASVVVVHASTRALIASLGGNCPLIDVTETAAPAETAATAGAGGPNPEVGAEAGDVAYIIYTSGSTGRPKGVQIEHRALLNLVSWHQRTYSVTPDDRATQLASPAFDASVWEVWPYLAAGASVHFPEEETRLSPARLWQWLTERKITLTFLPTPLAEAAMQELWPTRMRLRAILTGGDALKRRPPRGFPCPLVNHYGPTENTVVATFGLVAGRAESGLPAIGRPIANTRAYVLDREQQPVPVGVAGELYLGGESLARGYLDRPELTSEKFVSVTLEPKGAPERLYRTGDLVRWTPAGELEFLGRIDHQVKIRGCRVELGEIEAALQAHPAVLESLVLVRPDERGAGTLLAYVRLADENAREADLLQHLRTQLPAYMIPAALVRVAAWPLTPNGKIDRRALPVPSAPASAESVAEPVTPTEARVAQVWCEVLGRGRVGRDDNFFELGGHSLLAAQVVARLAAHFSTPVSVRLLFDQPTLAAFARELDQRARQSDSAARPIARLRRRVVRPEVEIVQPS